MVEYEGLVGAVTSGATTTIRGVGRKLRQLPSPDTTSMLEVTILVPFLELEYSVERSSRKRVKHTLQFNYIIYLENLQRKYTEDYSQSALLREGR